MRLWGIRVAILSAIVGMNVLEGWVLRPLIRRSGINLEATIIDEILLGVVMGVVVCVIHEVFRRRYERKLQAAVDELNHHVRNSLQVIVNQQELCPHCQPGDTAQAMQRVDWALKEVLPRELQPRRG
jgi:predicted PurR-regulated permease PerM